MWQTVFGIIATFGLAALLARQLLGNMAKSKAAPGHLFGEAMALLDNATISDGASVGVYRLTGTYRGHPAQVQAIVDTLNTRKLPSLWLMVTMPGPLPVKATLDLMMRPAGPSTFSNFDNLPVTLDHPDEFPDNAVLRTDDPDHVLPAHVLAPHLRPFFGPRAKELLVSPKGLRMVMQMAEGDRARYGVFRQADFGEARVDPVLLKDICDRLVALREDIEQWHKRTS